jgi:hypothetical protein
VHDLIGGRDSGCRASVTGGWVGIGRRLPRAEGWAWAGGQATTATYRRGQVAGAGVRVAEEGWAGGQ